LTSGLQSHIIYIFLYKGSPVHDGICGRFVFVPHFPVFLKPSADRKLSGVHKLYFCHTEPGSTLLQKYNLCTPGTYLKPVSGKLFNLLTMNVCKNSFNTFTLFFS